MGPLALDAGETMHCTFKVQLRLAQGTYHVNAYLHRYVTDQPYERWLHAATFFVGGTPTVRGVAHLAPSLVHCEKQSLVGPLTASGAALSAAAGGLVGEGVQEPAHRAMNESGERHVADT